MEEVTYFTEGVEVPATATNTEITTYMWPGFLGEFDHGTLTFTAWELVDSSRWLSRSDIMAPPLDCIGVCTVVTRQWVQDSSHWSAQGTVIRRRRSFPR
jgi:hypothetical protein